MKRLLLTAMLLAACGVAHAGGYYVKPGKVVCFTADALKQQHQYPDKLAPGCGVATTPIPVVLLKMNFFEPSKVKAVDGGTILWVSFGSLGEPGK